MSIQAVGAVRARMDAIESRFSTLRAVPGAVGANGVGRSAVQGFDASLDAALGLDALLLRRDAGGVETHSVDRSSQPAGIDAARAASTTLGSAIAVAAPPTGELGGSVAEGTPYAQQFELAGTRYGVPPRLLAAVGWVESGYRPDVISEAGAIGLMQIMPMTADELGVDPTDPVAAIDGAARLLAAHHDRFGSWDLALAAYHSGAGAVSRSGNTPPPRAAEYVRRVNERLEVA